MMQKTIAMTRRKKIALVAHDNKKEELVEWATFNCKLLAEHSLYSTRTTGQLLKKLPSLPNVAGWNAREAARQALVPNCSRVEPAPRLTGASHQPTVLPSNSDMQTAIAAEIATGVLGMELVTPPDAASSNPSPKPHVLPHVRKRQDL